MSIEIHCASCHYHAVTASEDKLDDKDFLDWAYANMTDHSRSTGHIFWNFGDEVTRKFEP